MLADYQIADQVRMFHMIDPFVDKESSNGRVSYGLTSAGYDARLGKSFYIATDEKNMTAVSPLTPGGKFPGIEYERKVVKLPGHTMALAHTQEFFKIPPNICATIVGKSTWARLGLNVFCTPLEPGWEGQVTLELFNLGFAPIELREGDGICQVQFHEISKPRQTYDQKHGKYQGQLGITFAIKSKEMEDDR